MAQAQGSVSGVENRKVDPPAKQGLLDKARTRVAREKDLSTSTQTAHYAPASMGQSPYVAMPGVGTAVFRKCGWGC